MAGSGVQRFNFTNEDKRLLARFLADYPATERTKPSTFHKFIDANPDTNHTHQSWFDHYRKAGKETINAFIEQERKHRQTDKQARRVTTGQINVPEPGPSHSTPRVPRASLQARAKSTGPRSAKHKSIAAPPPRPASRQRTVEREPESEVEEAAEVEVGPVSSVSPEPPAVAAPSPAPASRRGSSNRPSVRPPTPPPPALNANANNNNNNDDDDEDDQSMLDGADQEPTSSPKKSGSRNPFTKDDFDYYVKRLVQFKAQDLKLGELAKSLARERPSHTVFSWGTFRNRYRAELTRAAEIYAEDGKRAAKKYRRKAFIPKSAGRPRGKRESTFVQDDGRDQPADSSPRPSTSKAPPPKPASSAKRQANKRSPKTAPQPTSIRRREPTPSEDEDKEEGTPSPRQHKGKGKAIDDKSSDVADDDEFTTADDELWVTQHAKAQLRGWKPQAVWDFLGKQHSHHSAQQWEQHYKTKVVQFWHQIAAKGQELIAKLGEEASQVAGGVVTRALEVANGKTNRGKAKAPAQVSRLALREVLETSEDEDEVASELVVAREGDAFNGGESPPPPVATVPLSQPSPPRLDPLNAPAQADPSPPTPPRSGSHVGELETSVPADSDDRRLAKELRQAQRKAAAAGAVDALAEFPQYAWPERTSAERRMFAEFDDKVNELVAQREDRLGEGRAEEDDEEEEIVEESAEVDAEPVATVVASQGRGRMSRSAAMAEALEASIEELDRSRVEAEAAVEARTRSRTSSPANQPSAQSHKRSSEESASRELLALASKSAKKRKLVNGAESGTNQVPGNVALQAAAVPVETPQTKLKKQLKAAAAKHKLNFAQIRSLFHSISATTDLSLLDRAGAFYSTKSPHHPADPASAEYLDLKRLMKRVAWSPEEDTLVFGATEEEVAAIERRKGRRCLVARANYLRQMRVTAVEGVLAGWPWE